MVPPNTHLRDDGPHTHEIDTMQSGEAFGRGVTPSFTGDADETMPLIPPVGNRSAEEGSLDRSLEAPKHSVSASVS